MQLVLERYATGSTSRSTPSQYLRGAASYYTKGDDIVIVIP
jgi:hypothetical protein